MKLPETQAHIWLARPAAVTSNDHRERCLAVLNAAEQERRARFLFAPSRHEFLVAHALVRRSLSLYAPVKAADWTFRTIERGRPEIDQPAAHRDLRFNLSHTKGLVGLAVTCHVDIGFDLEDQRRVAEPAAIAESFFSPDEAADVLALPPHGVRERFFAYWTLKEAYIKARGLGLALPLDGFTFRLTPGRPIRIAFDASIDDDPAAWQFDHLRVGPHHHAAIAIRRGAAQPDRQLLVRMGKPAGR